MGHKINPDIYRLGVSKTWIFQLRTNKNFLKNLFLFKFLRNLFMNYTTPFFNFNTRRNQKVNDKLLFRGEEQLVSSPFVKTNLLFSHVFFGLLKSKLCIDSYFIDAAFKQVKKKNENSKRIHYYDIVEFRPWNSFYYKQIFIRNLKDKTKKPKSHLKRLFSNRIFKFINKNNNLFKVKPIRLISKGFFNYYKNINKRYNKNLFRYLNLNYKVFLRKKTRKKKKKKNYF